MGCSGCGWIEKDTSCGFPVTAGCLQGGGVAGTVRAADGMLGNWNVLPNVRRRAGNTRSSF
jgi:hypothetical protein